MRVIQKFEPGPSDSERSACMSRHGYLDNVRVETRKRASLFTSPILSWTTCALLAAGPAHATPPLEREDVRRSHEPFMKAYAVFMHPRCKNCHPAGDTPLQGDDSHVHDLLRLRRGVDGNGIYAMRCNNCQQAANSPGPHTPPGAPPDACRRRVAGRAAMAPPAPRNAHGLRGPVPGTVVPSAP